MHDQIRDFIKSNLTVRTGSKCIDRNVTPAEQKARNTLRDLITEAEWRRYLTSGFIMVKGHSGYWYQVFANRQNLKVYKDNKLTHTLCIHSDSNVCNTDHVINMKVLIDLDEAQIWAGANATALDHQKKPRIAEEILVQMAQRKDPTLIESFRALKKTQAVPVGYYLSSVG